MNSTPCLTGLTRGELLDIMTQWGEKPYRAQQIWSWVHVKLASDIEGMTDLSKDFRQRLGERFTLCRPKVRSRRISRDKTIKWLLELEDEACVEMVFIPETDRGTLCVSSQVGCSLSCPFCHTGTRRLERNLRVEEIVDQVVLARSEVAVEGGRVTNVVLMGMGEPLYNYDAVVKAVRIMMDANGLAIGSRKITLSTAGVVPRLVDVGRDLGVNLAISLHGVRDELRDRLVPLNKKFNLKALRQAVLAYPLKSGRRVTWEYVMLEGINDTEEDARELVRYLKGIPSKVNLIPFNPWPGTTFVPSTMERIQRFQEIVGQAGLVTVIRDRRGEDIEAACGQLVG
ncbi:MAG: 23S rRNA (adenine(2503)-C(2))-methyltransferase RlmN [Magnetococcales bacterium]|nr:23S rRNA (adenine(2503)-C(2))-methyltransferase RlmN [Magnetococcales bacterium]MBF0148906.1 23S rRNA (adenine(2503)-C(2))-methyltransferase RlmN [Magnetococcales bacterium]MBF0347606.1 23S rRNA (adenine(2503)-C(2))-methyltransferase RlmN [Magnetococcales bacterium]MBF0630105.1 23S rRNA (adenine(2503)-C(2))-methyltransferase RlmN [Magnetococcales bacterium]